MKSVNYLTSVRDSFSGSWPAALRRLAILFCISLSVGSIFPLLQGQQPGIETLAGSLIGTLSIGALSLYLRHKYPMNEKQQEKKGMNEIAEIMKIGRKCKADTPGYSQEVYDAVVSEM